MFELNQIRQFVKVVECKTLSKAAEELFITQPALSRSMKNLESELGVELFYRNKNKIILNKNGDKFYKDAKALLCQAEKIKDDIQLFDKSNRTIILGSCAPLPLNPNFDFSKIIVEIDNPDNLLKKLREGKYSLIMLPEYIEEDIACIPFIKQRLGVLVDSDMKEFSSKDRISFSELEGQSLLLLPLKGYWNELITSRIKNAHFIEHNNVEDYIEILRNTKLISFIPDIAQKEVIGIENKKVIPISDKEAQLTYYLVCIKSEQKVYKDFFEYYDPQFLEDCQPYSHK